MLAYKVENQIRGALEGLPGFVDRVYVVDDGSPDRTSEVVRSLVHDRVRLIKHKTNQGPGGALSTGYRAALADGMQVVVKVDGDGQMPMDQMENLIVPIVERQADYTKGDRLSIARHRNGMPPFRFAGNLMLTWLTRVASGYWRLNDAQNGYTAISREALERIDLGFYSYYGYLNDLLVQLNVGGHRMKDVTMPARYGTEKSSIRLGTYVPKVSLLLLGLFFWRLRQKYFRGKEMRKALRGGEAR